ncbi:MAG: VanW family protein [Lachnospiraceae bacterium]|nr:VanW family protein [Lachnospiraceae bacterium]
MKQRKKMIIATVIVFFIVALAGMFGVVHSASSDDKILKNVYIDTVYVGGMTTDEAEKAIDTYIEETEKAQITLKAGKKTKSFSAEKAGITFDGKKAVKDAYGAGREGNLISKFIEVCKLKKSKEVINLKTSITERQAKAILEDNEKKLIVKTKNASLTRKDGEFEIIDAESGQEIVYDKSISTICDEVAGWNKKDLSIKISVKEEKPEYTADDLKEVKDVLGTYTTSYASSSYNRKRNVENGCSKINGTTLYPGETMSVYGTVAPFTSENGYYTAPSYASGKVVETYGGGICQVSTTLYNAVLRSELKVTERLNHSMTVHYVPLAADAAIAGTSKDLKFKNNKKTPIYIEGKAGGGTITFTIYGKETRDENRTIEFESKTISVKSPGKVEVKDSTLEEGKTVVKESGTTGYVAELWKVVYVDGKEKERTKVNTSSYRSTPTTVAVGTKKKEEKKEEKKDKQNTTETTTTEKSKNTEIKKNSTSTAESTAEEKKE